MFRELGRQCSDKNADNPDIGQGFLRQPSSPISFGVPSWHCVQAFSESGQTRQESLPPSPSSKRWWEFPPGRLAEGFRSNSPPGATFPQNAIESAKLKRPNRMACHVRLTLGPERPDLQWGFRRAGPTARGHAVPCNHRIRFLVRRAGYGAIALAFLLHQQAAAARFVGWVIKMIGTSTTEPTVSP